TPDFTAVGAYDGMAAIVHAVQATKGKMDGDAAVKSLLGWKFDSPQGPIMIDPDTRDIVMNEYLAEVVKGPDGKLHQKVIGQIDRVKDESKAQSIGPCAPKKCCNPVESFSRWRPLRQRTGRPRNICRPAGPFVIAGIDVASILLGGLAAGTVLFIVSVGLSVTMGLMGFINLAHGAFAMFGGYIIVLAMNRGHFGFTVALALGFAA